MPNKTLPVLVNRLIDYAGLFPPARLDMTPAVAEFARERGSGDAWILARFVVPIGRLAELEAAARDHLDGNPWPLSVLTGGSADDRARIDAFNADHREDGAVIESVELKASSDEDVTCQAPLFADLETYFEIPHDRDPSTLMATIAAHGARAKIRTGGITADAMPSTAQVARFIRAAARTGVAFKATAGLHHPLRGEYRLSYEPDSDSATMHGYLNVFLASALARGNELSEPEIVDLLEERDASAFELTDETVRWRHHEIGRRELAAAREDFVTSYGSCSFREPVDELRELHLL